MKKVVKIYTLRLTQSQVVLITRALAKIVDENGFITSEALALIRRIIKEIGR